MFKELAVTIAAAAVIGLAGAPIAEASPSTTTDASGGSNTQVRAPSPVDRLQNSDPSWQNVTTRLNQGIRDILNMFSGQSDLWQRLGTTISVITHPGSAANPAQISSHGLPGTAP